MAAPDIVVDNCTFQTTEKTSSSIFAALEDEPILTDPFEHFIYDVPITKSNCHDPLLWWGKLSPYSTPAARKLPNNAALIRMAQDFLGAPASSTDIERAFSHAGGMVTKRRHALKPETIRANSLVAAWAKADLVPRKDVLEKLGARQSRKKQLNTIDLASTDSE